MMFLLHNTTQGHILSFLLFLAAGHLCSFTNPHLLLCPCVWFCLSREQFLKSNAQLTFRCRQLLSELSYIYPIDVVSSTWRVSTAQHNSYKRLAEDKAEVLYSAVISESECHDHR